MILPALAVAATLGKPPVPLHDNRWFDGSHLAWLKASWTRVDLTIDASGKPVRCVVAASSGLPALDKIACAMPKKAAHYLPALDEDGQPVAAVFSQTLSIDMEPPRPPLTNYGVPVSGLPASATNPFVTLRLVVEPDGKIASCAVEVTSGNLQLDRLGCSATANAPLTPVLDRVGTPLRAQQLLRIGFITDTKPVN